MHQFAFWQEKNKEDNFTSVLIFIYWLSDYLRIEFKHLLIVFKSFKGFGTSLLVCQSSEVY